MTHIIREGGDTDTNAAIAGGMIGALIGLSQIDEVMRNKVLTFDCTQKNYKFKNANRPACFST